MSLATRAIRRAAWRLSARLGGPVGAGSDVTTTVLLTCSHEARRPNLGWTIQQVLRCRFVDRLVVSNHNPQLRLEDVEGINDPRVTLVTQPTARGCGFRWRVMERFPFEHLISIDDDVLIYPAQLAALLRALVRHPETPHGLSGVRRDADGRLTYLQRTDAPVNYLTEVFAVTAQHLERYRQLRDALVRRSDTLEEEIENAADYILLSQSGSTNPVIHDIGYILRCETFRDPDVAVWLRSGFEAQTGNVVTALDGYLGEGH